MTAVTRNAAITAKLRQSRRGQTSSWAAFGHFVILLAVLLWCPAAHADGDAAVSGLLPQLADGATANVNPFNGSFVHTVG